MKRLIEKLFVIITVIALSNPTVIAKSHIYAANRDAGKYVALTFDDGPHPVYTEQILDILKEHDAKATFFVIGKNAESYPQIVKREYDEGHEIGNHTFSHPDMNKISVDKAVEEILLTQNIINEITGNKPALFRSPGGIFTDELVLRIEELDCKSVSWSWKQDTKDWNDTTVEKIVDCVINNLQNGDIILFHDYNVKGSPTPKALKVLLPQLKSLGYSVVTVSELLSLNQFAENRNTGSCPCFRSY